ncbi:unnamed protein product [Clonostachys rosea f. rosea IK726]|uniref:Uncharacterized protein n=1 Tax=Clonostachys rosea f. rosea IK726 TaxID=1349383 RepID=A0ACA9U384_BIOOC|nr:unnamed protein product [Clonostachys rosea f. rosea IK726]
MQNVIVCFDAMACPRRQKSLRSFWQRVVCLVRDAGRDDEDVAGLGLERDTSLFPGIAVCVGMEVI